MPDNIIFTLNVPKELQDEIIDILMDFPSITGFNLNQINGYSKEHSCYDLAEQVEGFRLFSQFEILLPEQFLNDIKLVLNPICQPARLKYWITPVLESGHF